VVRAITFITSLTLALITRVGVGVTLGVCGCGWGSVCWSWACVCGWGSGCGRGVCGCGHVGTGVITMGATKGRVALRVITMVSMGMRMRG